MLKQSTVLNPLDAKYTAHHGEEARRRATKDWLRQRERELGFVTDAPPVAPDHRKRCSRRTLTTAYGRLAT
jgi:hypothetical protein